eukprot:scaffold1352_cov180-Amphora_coffeaeformis.AAC.12
MHRHIQIAGKRGVPNGQGSNLNITIGQSQLGLRDRRGDGLPPPTNKIVAPSHDRKRQRYIVIFRDRARRQSRTEWFSQKMTASLRSQTTVSS